MNETAHRPSPSPLAIPIFRAIWLASVVSNVGTWMQNVGTAWLMTSLAPTPLMVALVQAATSAPMFLMALPAGALADVVDRRRVLLVAQSWMLLAAALLAVITWLGLVTPVWLLLLTFALGLGVALNAPAWQAVVPELVPPEHLSSAVTLSSISMNVARAVGPALGGLVVAAAGPAAAFALNSVSFVGVLLVLFRWRQPPGPAGLPPERVGSAMAVGVRYMLHAPRFQSVLVRSVAFNFFGTALWAHLPLVARAQLGLDATGYGILLGAIGIGAVSAAPVLLRVRKRVPANTLVAFASVGFALCLFAMGQVTDLTLMCLLLLPTGGLWVTVLSTLNVAARTSVPAWVRARALSGYLLTFFGGMALGSVCWGAVAARTGIDVSLAAAAGGMVAAMLITLPFRLEAASGTGLLPSQHWPAPLIHPEARPGDGPVIVSIHYTIPADRRERFVALMRQFRSVRIRTGAYRWYLSCDLADPTAWTETFFVPSWAEHQRQHGRVSNEDAELQAQVRQCHAADAPPRVTHALVEQL